MTVFGQSPANVLGGVAGLEPSTPSFNGAFPVITITADSFDFLLDEEKAIFRGDVEASQGNHTFRSSQLTVHLDQVQTSAQTTTGTKTEQTGQLSLPFHLSARSVSYDLAKNVVIGEGDSQLQRGRELILAEKIHYDLVERVAFARPMKGSRVLVRFYSNPERPMFPGKKLPALVAAE